MHRFQLVNKILQLNTLNFENYWLVDLNFRAPDWPKFKLFSQIYCRPCRYIFTHFRYTFSKTHFWLFSISLELKPHGKPIQLGFWAQKSGFWAIRNFFFEKSCIFGEKTKKKILLILFASECPKTHPRHELLLFLSYKPIQLVKMAKIGHL